MLYFLKHGAYQQSKSSVVDHTGPYQLLTKREVKILDIKTKMESGSINFQNHANIQPSLPKKLGQ